MEAFKDLGNALRVEISQYSSSGDAEATSDCVVEILSMYAFLISDLLGLFPLNDRNKILSLLSTMIQEGCRLKVGSLGVLESQMEDS